MNSNETVNSPVDVIRKVESILLKLIAKNKLLGGEITTFRWDAFDITLHWKEEGGLEKNLHIYYTPLLGDVAFPGTLALEGSAWQDNWPEGKHSKGIRKWTTRVFGTTSVNAEKDIYNITPLIRKAYKKIKQWTLDDLTLAPAPLEPFPY